MSAARKVSVRGAAVVIALGVICSAASGGTETWSFDITTNGQDVFWTSPTAVDNTAPRYLAEYEITLIEVSGTVFGIPITEDVTDEIPEEDRAGSDTIDGPPPIVLLDDDVVYPEPPEDPSVAASVFIEIDADGFGQLSVTDVVLGTVDVDVPPFGVVTVNITSVRLAGIVSITPLGPLGDLTGNGSVGLPDLLILINSWGPCPDPDDCPADLNGDGVVNLQDLIVLINNWG